MNWQPYLPCVLGGLVYIITTELFPNQSHFLISMLDSFVLIVTYYLLPKELIVWQRVLISEVVTIIIFCIFRFI